MDSLGELDPMESRDPMVSQDPTDLVETLDPKEQRERMDLRVTLDHKVLVVTQVIPETRAYLVVWEMMVHLELPGFPGNRDQLEPRDRRESREWRYVHSCTVEPP